MGSETFLISTSTPAMPPFGAWSASEELLTAKNSIPLFWYMLFDRASVVPAEELDDSGEATKYLALSDSTARALALAQSRWTHVRVALGTDKDNLFARWADFVGRHASDFIHCETWDWCLVYKTPRDFRSHLMVCIDAFDHVPRLRKGQPALNRWWRALLGQCGAFYCDERVRPIGDFSYCGVACGGERMTWSRDLYDT